MYSVRVLMSTRDEATKRMRSRSRSRSRCRSFARCLAPINNTINNTININNIINNNTTNNTININNTIVVSRDLRHSIYCCIVRSNLSIDDSSVSSRPTTSLPHRCSMPFGRAADSSIDHGQVTQPQRLRAVPRRAMRHDVRQCSPASVSSIHPSMHTCMHLSLIHWFDIANRND